MPTGKLILQTLACILVTIFCVQQAQTNTKGLLIDRIIPLSPHEACIFYGFGAVVCGCMGILGILRLWGWGKPYGYTPYFSKGIWGWYKKILISLNLVGLLCLVIYGFLNPYPQNFLSQSQASSEPATEVHDESIYYGTPSTDFGKNWVLVDGKTIQGISQANPAANGEVAILYSEGGKDIPANKLPEGFLLAWQLTPERLKAADVR